MKPRQLDPAIVCTLFIIQTRPKPVLRSPMPIILLPRMPPRRAQEASRRGRGVCVMVAACVARRGAPPPASSPAHSDLYQDVAGRSSTNRHKHEPQSLYSHPQSSPSSSALVRALPRRPKQSPPACHPRRGRPFSTLAFTAPVRDPHTIFGRYGRRSTACTCPLACTPSCRRARRGRW